MIAGPRRRNRIGTPRDFFVVVGEQVLGSAENQPVPIRVVARKRVDVIGRVEPAVPKEERAAKTDAARIGLNPRRGLEALVCGEDLDRHRYLAEAT